jgi:hypothetical protein
MPPKYHDLPDADRVMRFVPWKKLRRDEEDNVVGFLPEAFQLRPEEASLSVNWVEFFPESSNQLHECVRAFRNSMSVGAKSAFAVGNVGQIKEVCQGRGSKIRILHEPKDGEPAHSGIHRLPRDELLLLAALADDAFTEMVRNADVSAALP